MNNITIFGKVKNMIDIMDSVSFNPASTDTYEIRQNQLDTMNTYLTELAGDFHPSSGKSFHSNELKESNFDSVKEILVEYANLDCHKTSNSYSNYADYDKDEIVIKSVFKDFLKYYIKKSNGTIRKLEIEIKDLKKEVEAKEELLESSIEDMSSILPEVSND